MLDEAAIGKLAARAVEVLPGGEASPYLLIAEHAGNQVPAGWNGLGLSPAFLDTHFAVDLGIDALTRRLSQKLRAPAVIARYSRLFLDYNRPAGEWDHMRPDMGGIPVPGNLAVDADERRLRECIAWAPVETAITAAAEGRHALVSVHSFTPVMAGSRREVDIGVLWREPSAFVSAMLDKVAELGVAAGLRVGENEPYDWRQAIGYTLNRHGLQHERPCLYIEARNDIVSDPEKFGRVADVLENALAAVAEELWPRRAE